MNKKFRENKPNKQDFESVRSRMRKTESQLRKEKRVLLNKEERNVENLDQEEIDHIIHNIRMYYQTNDLKSVFSSMNQICRALENGIDILYNNELFQPIFLYMNEELSTKNLVLCISSLGDLIDESFGSISSILNSEFFAVLKKLCDHDDLVRLSVFNLLSKISSHDEESCFFLLESNITELLISYDNLQQYTCKIIRCVLEYKPVGSDFVSRDFTKIIKRYIWDSDYNCKLDIIWSFLYILDNNFIGVSELIDQDLLKYFTHLISDGNEKINLPIFRIFNCMYSEDNIQNDSLKTSLIKNEVLGLIYSTFPLQNYDCWKECISFLTNIASGNIDNIIALKNSNILSCIIYSLTNGTYRIQEEAVYFFSNITKEESAGEILFWFSRDVVSLFCKLLRPENIDLNCIIVDTLTRALLNSNNYEELCNIFTECNVINYIEESQFHMTDCGFKLHKDFLSALSGENSIEMIEDDNMVFDF